MTCLSSLPEDAVQEVLLFKVVAFLTLWLAGVTLSPVRRVSAEFSSALAHKLFPAF
jgi:hypothetical protein